MNNKLTHTLLSSLGAILVLGIAPEQCFAQTRQTIVPTRVADLNPTGGSNPVDLHIGGTGNSTIYFVAAVPGKASIPVPTLYRSDGSTKGTVKLDEHPSGIEIIAANIKAMAYVKKNAAGKAVNLIIHRGTLGNLEHPLLPVHDYKGYNATLTNDLLLSGAALTTDIGFEPYTFSLTERRSTLIRDMATGSDHSQASTFFYTGTKWYFSPWSTTLCRTDLTPTGTKCSTDPASGFANYYKFEPGSSGQQILHTGAASYLPGWMILGNQPLGGQILQEVVISISDQWTSSYMSAPQYESMDPQYLTSFNGKTYLYGTAFFPSGEFEYLWDRRPGVITRGVDGTELVSEGNCKHLMAFNGAMWFFRYNNAQGAFALWSSDGTSAGTRSRYVLEAGYEPSTPIGCNGKLYFTMTAGRATKLWRVDGGALGPQQVAPTNAVAPNSISSEAMKVMNNALYFVADFDGTGAELWKVQ